jgi:hypothetical protein
MSPDFDKYVSLHDRNSRASLVRYEFLDDDMQDSVSG